MGGGNKLTGRAFMDFHFTREEGVSRGGSGDAVKSMGLILAEDTHLIG